MAGRKTRAAAKAQEESTNPLESEDQILEQERDDDQEQLIDDPIQEEDMARPKSRKGGKNGAKKKAGKKAKVTLTPECTPEAETIEETPAPAVQGEKEFNPAAMPVLRSPKKDAGKCRTNPLHHSAPIQPSTK